MKIGILGGGQLARMLMEESYKYGINFTLLSGEINSPAGQITKSEIVGDWNDNECLTSFAKDCDLITLENEFIDYRRIEFLENLGRIVYPDSVTVKLIQDKLCQKNTLRKTGIPVAEFSEVNSVSELSEFTKRNSYPVVLKSRTMGYDGKGNYTINSAEEIDKAFSELSGRGKLMVESFVKFDREIATQVVRNKSGEIKVYPVVETIQKDHICKLVIASKNLFGELKNKVNEIASKIVTDLNYIGVMGIEMFLSGDKILVNELAPRVHNSGHYTIEGSYTSQFENHIRAILNLPLGNTDMNCENCVMINILGERNGSSEITGADKVLKNDKVYLHLYGKKDTQKGRKMGHITVIGEDLKKTISLAESSRNELSI